MKKDKPLHPGGTERSGFTTEGSSGWGGAQKVRCHKLIILDQKDKKFKKEQKSLSKHALFQQFIAHFIILMNFVIL